MTEPIEALLRQVDEAILVNDYKKALKAQEQVIEVDKKAIGYHYEHLSRILFTSGKIEESLDAGLHAAEWFTTRGDHKSAVRVYEFLVTFIHLQPSERVAITFCYVSVLSYVSMCYTDDLPYDKATKHLIDLSIMCPVFGKSTEYTKAKERIELFMSNR